MWWLNKTNYFQNLNLFTHIFENISDDAICNNLEFSLWTTHVKSTLRSAWCVLMESDRDGVCTVKSRSVEEDAPVCSSEYWPYLSGVGGDRAGLYIVGSCPSARGIIPVSIASGWTVVMFELWGFIVLVYTNNGSFRVTCEEVWNGWLYTVRGWVEKLLYFRCFNTWC